MKLAISLAPLPIFFIAYRLGGIYVATVVLVVALYAAVALEWMLDRKLNRTLVAVAILATVLGALTIALHNPVFIKLKPTLIYAVFAIACLGSQFFGEQVLMERLMNSAMTLPHEVWRRVNLAWAGFFAGCAALNYYIAFNFSESAWVHFKVIGFTVLPFVFALAQAPFLARYLQDETTTSTQPP